MPGILKPHVIFVGYIICLYETAVLSQFTIIDTAVTWNQAKTECNNRGLELAVIDTADKFTIIFDQILARQPFSTSDRFWIGLRWSPDIIKFKWINNEVVNDHSNLPWKDGGIEPNSMGNEPESSNQYQNCIFIAYSTRLDTRTQTCNNQYFVICSQAMTTESSLIETTAITTLGNTESSQASPAHTTDAETGVRAIVYCPSGTDSMCECRVVQNVSNVISNQGDKILYKVDKKTTKAYLRKHRSAYDGRMSAKVLGYAGYAVLIGVASLVVVMDATRLFQTR